MRRSLRDSAGGPFSLFAFQDIIFSVTAVLLFAAIWLALSSRVLGLVHGAAELASRQRLEALTAAISAAEARAQPSRAGGASTSEPLTGGWNRAGAGELDLGELREEVNRAEALAAGAVRAVRAEEAAWMALQRRLEVARVQAQDSLVRVDGVSPEAEVILLLIAGGEAEMERHSRSGEMLPLRLDRALTALEERLRQEDRKSVLWWIGLRPSGAVHFDRLTALLQAIGVRHQLVPIGEAQEVRFHSEERALRVLEETP